MSSKAKLKTRGERGQALIMMVFVTTIILVIGVIAIDFGLVLSERNHLRIVADAAALAGAGQLPCGPAVTTAATSYAARNGDTSGVTVNCPPTSGPHVGDTNYVEVEISHDVGLEFGSMFGVGNITATGRSVAAQTNANVPPYNFVALNHASSCPNHTLLIDNSGGTLEVTADIYVNSCNLQTETGGCNDGDAFDVFGGGSLIAHRIFVVGGWELDGGRCNQSTVTCTADTVCPRDRLGSSAVLADPFAGVAPPSLGTPACTSTVYGSAQSYNPKQFLLGTITATQTTIVSTGTLVQNGDMIVIDSEDMLVTGGGGTITLTVVRAQNGTTAATHNTGKEIKKLPVTGTQGTAANPAPCTISSGSVTLQPGTYYGGIKIQNTANVTLTRGIYVMAGGGFQVLNSATLTAPDAMIYNTDDASTYGGAQSYSPKQTLADSPSISASQTIIHSSGTAIQTGDMIQIDTEKMLVQAGGGTTTLTVARGQLGTTAVGHTFGKEIKLVPLTSPPGGAFAAITLNTTGNVTLGPQTSGTYSGLTIFQDRANAQGINFLKMGNGINGISGTIYGANDSTTFDLEMGGTANLAVVTGKILLSADVHAIFAFDPHGLFGTGTHLVE